MNYNKFCDPNDHDFGRWEETTVVTPAIFGFGYVPLKQTIFTRQCKICGAIQECLERTTPKEPLFTVISKKRRLPVGRR